MSITVILILPVISALIGWLTNVIAVKMIFRPHLAINILGIKIQGLIPKRRHELAERIGEIVESELISHEDISRILKSDEVNEKIKNLLDSKLDNVIKAFGESLGPMVMAFLNDELIQKIKNKLSEMIIRMLPDFIDEIITHMEQNISFKETVISKIEEFELHKLEDLILRIASKELKHIEFLGAVLGLIIGICQVLILNIL